MIHYAVKKLKTSYKKRTCGKNLLHNLHGQFFGFHTFISI